MAATGLQVAYLQHGDAQWRMRVGDSVSNWAGGEKKKTIHILSRIRVDILEGSIQKLCLSRA